ncbi:uncharacterized protein LOC130749578 [Lotus japonicus]|uniref:uncharacterized protein LOC130749578 n=1 Tax=Lotus japonicus TaxID=34305 RepID=UPI00258BCB1A|nr:uncharacterized protein LOC130749578 [Lotus japonicus]
MSSYTNMMMMMMEPQEQPHFKKPKLALPPPPLNHHHHHHHHHHSSFKKTQLCRRFQQHGMCGFGSKCNFAHGIAELNRLNNIQPPNPQLCRMFSRNKHCTYGHSCRFRHSSTARNVDYPNWVREVSRHPPQEQGKHDRYSYAEYRVMQTSAAATNASTNTVEASSLRKNEPYAVKFMFKKNDLRKISGIYADWI